MATEVCIEMFVHDKIIRPYFGDFLVVILIYSFLRIFLKVPKVKLAISVLLFSYTVEGLQYSNLLHHLNLQDSYAANIIFGNTFEWLDMLAYTLGILLVIVLGKVKLFKSAKSSQAQ
ncbi:DUF2809 domain-containing protein [Rapidithrix thailandica]|uniref:ribosomal maturation YjgA family protein n=1 Tax=Rapidithrix thailandica TaxID=413964 RepID=UPI00321704E9